MRLTFDDLEITLDDMDLNPHNISLLPDCMETSPKHERSTTQAHVRSKEQIKLNF